MDLAWEWIEWGLGSNRRAGRVLGKMKRVVHGVSPGKIHLPLAAIASGRAYYRRHLRFTNAGGKCGLGGPS